MTVVEQNQRPVEIVGSTMDSLFTINTCKTYGCPNLGLATSPDYQWPDYRLGYPALHCRACGSYPPLFNDEEFQRWAAACFTGYAREYGHFCPACYQAEVIRYGHNPGGSQRLQCQRCKKVWTPKRQPLTNALSPDAICSVPFIMDFQGELAAQKLYLLFSFDAVRGNILHVSSNYTPYPAGNTLRYRWKGIRPTPTHHHDIIQSVALKERQFLQRSQFDEIQYGAAALKRNANGMILRPVIAAHGHFRVLKNRFPEVGTHIVAHECFLRGAIITAWAELFRQRRASLWFIEEKTVDEDNTDAWRLLGKTNQGWWKNQWQLWAQGRNQKMVCPLTDHRQDNGSKITLTASRRFFRWLAVQDEFQQSSRYSAAHIMRLVTALACQYNAQNDENIPTVISPL